MVRVSGSDDDHIFISPEHLLRDFTLITDTHTAVDDINKVDPKVFTQSQRDINVVSADNNRLRAELRQAHRLLSNAGAPLNLRFEDKIKWIADKLSIAEEIADNLKSNLNSTFQTRTLRDEFAMAAVSGVDGITFKDLADRAYRVADAVMEARKEVAK